MQTLPFAQQYISDDNSDDDDYSNDDDGDYLSLSITHGSEQRSDHIIDFGPSRWSTCFVVFVVLENSYSILEYF